MAKISAAARAKAHSPEARAKATATRAKNREQKVLEAGQQANTPIEGVPDGGTHMSLDAIPDREPKQRGRPKKVVHAGHWISEADYMILKMAKMMLKEGK